MCSKFNPSFAFVFRRAVCMLLALLTIGSLCFLPGNVGEASAATKKVSIPDPASYFGDVDKTERGNNSTIYYCEGHSAYPQSKIESYIKALEKAGLTAGRIKSLTEGDKYTTLTYEGEQCVWIRWNKSEKHVRVNISDDLSVTSSIDTTITANTGKKPTIPSPGDYFGGVDKTNPGSKWTVYYCNGHSTYPQSAMESYVKALKNAGLTGGTVSKQSNGDMLATLNYNGVHVVSVRWYKGDKYVWVNVSDSISVAAPNSEETVVTPTKPATDETTKVSILDILEDCFGSYTKNSYNEKEYNTTYWYKNTSSFPESKVEKLKKTAEDMKMKFFLHDFRNYKRFSLDAGVGGSLIGGRWDKNTGEFKVVVEWEYIKKAGVFDESDVPEEPAPEPTTPIPTDRKRCFWCGGDGKCPDCDGSGYKMKWVSGTVREYVQQNCTSCYSPGKCRDCGGSGWE